MPGSHTRNGRACVDNGARLALKTANRWPTWYEGSRLEMMTDDRAQILATLALLLREVLADEWDESIEVEMATSFADDLELESIEFVALAERVQETFGADLDFVTWLSDLEFDAIIALTVGDVVEFIERCR